ncbi:unnamed protein product [Candida verbasci]|uniref:ATP-dependent RNA helicase ECM32 n=1 Tax=Candida verbasci TaxID=1227364 RepID=A0A9W4TQT3_9ASCO|nr:unnamed protein product [Candida verbasci]
MSNDYTCVTCSETFGQDIQKHLSTTRHKSVELNFYDDEILQCEDCSDSNIHQLTIARYGFSDMSLLCSLCLDKENKSSGETPSASYSLSNGAIFIKLQQYLKFRDLECSNCGDDSHLYVGNTKSGQIISCRKCLPTFEAEGLKFTSENDDNFLKELLGLKETTAKKSNRRRKVGKGKGKGKSGKKGRGKGRIKKEDPEAEERRAHYFESKKFAQGVKSGSTVKAIGSEGSAKPDTRVNKNDKRGFKSRSTPSSGKQSPAKHTPANSGRNTPSRNTPTNSGRSTPKPSSAKPLKSNSDHKSTKSSQGSCIKPNSSNNSYVKSLDGPLSNPQQSKSINSKVPDDPIPSDKIKRSNKGPNKNGTSKNVTKSFNEDHSKAIIKPTHRSRDKPSSKSTIKGNGVSAHDHSNKSSKLTTNTKNNKEATPSSDEFIIPEYITKYLPSSKPKLTYDSINEYFREMSFNMFLEDQLNNVSKLMDSSFFTIEWFEDQDKKNNQFKLSIPLKNIEKFVSQRLKNLKKNPFNVDQALFLILDNDIPWYCKIATMDEVRKRDKSKRRRGKSRVGSSEVIIEMIITLFKWNDQQLPKTVHVQHLQMLPASIPVSRVLTAMDNLSNPTFIKMLLGKEPIKQINFRNYVKFSKPAINDSQKVAIQSVLNNAITVLQGPPGTGKTSTIFEIILQLLTSLNTYPILVVAASNIAIDNIAEKLIESGHGKDILRITANEKERDYDSSHPLNSVCLHSKIYNALSLKFKDVVHDLQFNPSKVSANGYKKYLAEKFLITKQFVRQAKVILTTTVVAGGAQLKSVKKCPVVIMDEATQSSEPTSLIPLSMSGVDKYVFVGDSKQLSCFTLIPSLSLSLFERILLNGSYKNPHMLDTQYRMHPDISEFPRNRFYQGLLKDGISKEARIVENVSNSVYFWDTKGQNPEKSIKNFLREDHGFTYTNPGEIENIITALKVLIYEKNVKRENIGIITGYSGQRDLISSTLIRNEFINVGQEELKLEIDLDDIANDSKPVTIHYVSNIMIASIDAFQGREKDFLIMSCVRSNEQNKIGFLKDERRLNVALTRAKYGLIMIGDVKCLKNGDKLWNEYLKYLEDKKSIHEEFIY